MSRSFRFHAALAGCAALVALSAPAVVHAEPTESAAAPTDAVADGLVQIQTEVTGSVYVAFDVETASRTGVSRSPIR